METDQLHEERILILDFGSQYTQLIARRVRESHVYCEIHPFNKTLDAIRRVPTQGDHPLGRPVQCLRSERAALRSGDLFAGHSGAGDLLRPAAHGPPTGRPGGEARRNGNTVRPRSISISPRSSSVMWKPHDVRVWMSHGDRILADASRVSCNWHTATTRRWPPWAIPERQCYGVQFHPEVAHTPCGRTILDNFLFGICRCKPTWTMKSFVESVIQTTSQTIGDDQVICALSGGVDSSVVAVLLHKAIGSTAALHFRQQRAAAQGRGRRGAARVPRPFRDEPHLCGCLRALLDPSPRGDRPGAKAQDHREQLHRGVRKGSREACQRQISGTRDPLPGCDRKRVLQRAFRHHQDPSQCGRPAGTDATEADRAPAGAVQGRSAAGGTGAGLAGTRHHAPSLSRDRGWPSA